MSRLSTVTLALAALLAAPQLAHATVFSGQASFKDLTTGNALQVNATPNPASFI